MKLYETFNLNVLLDFDPLGKFVLKASVHLTFKELIVLLLRKKSVQLPSVLTDLLNR